LLKVLMLTSLLLSALISGAVSGGPPPERHSLRMKSTKSKLNKHKNILITDEDLFQSRNSQVGKIFDYLSELFFGAE